MRADSSRWALLACAALAALGCSDDSGLAECVDGSPRGQTDGPRLTGPPTFAQSEIAPGAPVVLSVPVNDQTRRVFAGYETEDSGGGEPMETDGGTTVEFRFDPGPRTPGIEFWNGSISLEGEGAPGSALYRANDDLTAYEFSFEAGEGYNPLCRTPFAPPTFVVVD